MVDEENVPSPDALLDAPGEACATLTPLIREKMRELQSEAVLEVRSDDPAAREGVPAWSRLTGNSLLATIEEDERTTRFYLRKK
ncbi:MAG TPA: sulfurtransferase TusA family protein [Dehalococcoidia bacterium]|nr:sulfurtransferase TusA family protein [Dehalococcoidia bacterium]